MTIWIYTRRETRSCFPTRRRRNRYGSIRYSMLSKRTKRGRLPALASQSSSRYCGMVNRQEEDSPKAGDADG